LAFIEVVWNEKMDVQRNNQNEMLNESELFLDYLLEFFIMI
jgi:hypothetical protein